jgi:Leucine-rich repeat (LRR) protein
MSSINGNVFEGLSNLTSLDLSNNQLISINEKGFEGLGSLQKLNLDNNKISSINEKPFIQLDSLEQINFSRNNLSNEVKNLFKKNLKKVLPKCRRIYFDLF